MIIRKDQVLALERTDVPEFEDFMVEHLKVFSPLHSQSLGEAGIRSLIQAGTERARRHGFTRRGPVRFHIETAILFGIDFDTDPQYPWLAPLLDDPALAEEVERADRVHEVVTDYLERVAGDDRGLARRSLQRARSLPFEPISTTAPDFADRLIERASATYPEKAAAVGRPALLRLIDRAVEEARRWDSATDAGVCLFFGIMFSVGHGFIVDPKYPWVANTLRQSGYSPDRRVERLYSKTMIYLDRVLDHLGRE